ncbi:DUF4115 domain-containing protein [Lysobacter ciconiae]|uniref:DUF4115 domain-containing protein n=1 Tax=Novilysobacter ciconiae TaxID=2781022 RepID=A0A7S6ZT78_9GAMM|nr:helix-turn-helix domain-containing protein [Lysobacter ciconiae]QOW20645.1 DUF4115 domain-containing protein [Lysobacter ciconiae]
MGQSNERLADDAGRCGARLARARESAGLTLEQASARLKMPVRVVRALENDEWQSEPTVFVRGHLRSYARMLGVDIEQDLVRSGVNEVRPAELISHTHTPKYRYMFEQAARRGIYIAITAFIVVPVWLATKPHLSSAPEVQSLDIPSFATGMVDSPRQADAAVQERTPVIASMAAIRAPVGVAESPGLSLAFSGDSWLQVTTRSGEVLEQAVVGSGEKRQWDAKEDLRIVIGNTAAIEARQNGKPVDLEAFSRANVARFTLSSDGSLVPSSD